jgi:nicotinate phosphoribosyltransferase
MLDSPSAGEIVAGGVTDHCCTLSLDVLRNLGLGRRVVTLEAHARRFPAGVDRGIFYGLRDVLAILGERPVRVWSLEPGSNFYAGEPVLVIEGHAEDLALVRPALTGVLTFASSFVSRAAEFVRAAAGKPVFFFGLRKLHPAHVRQYLECAWVAGMEISATPQSAGIVPLLVLEDCQEHFANLVADDPADSWAAFLNLPQGSGAIFIVLDNYDDPVVEVQRAAKKFGRKLSGVLIDTDSSRRGNIVSIISEVAWHLELMGRGDVKLCLTGNVTPSLVADTAATVASYGVGLSVLDARMFDFSLQIVAVDGLPRSKLGVKPGRKSVFACPECGKRSTALADGQPQCCGRPMDSRHVEIRPSEIPDLARTREAISKIG